MADKNLYQWLGGMNAIASVVDRFSYEIINYPKRNENPALQESKKTRPLLVRYHLSSGQSNW